MKNVTIIGVGLIGGSLGMALRRGRKAYRVTGLGRNETRLKHAMKLGAVDDWSTDWRRGVENADIVVVCTPVDLIARTVKNIRPFLKPGALITDVGSVKGSVVRGVKKILSLHPAPCTLRPVFIGGHPMAGSEKTGVRSASADLYRGASVVLTPEPRIPDSALAELKALWKRAGARVLVMTPERHDRIVACVSHLPHALAFTLCSSAGAAQRVDGDTKKLLAGSFRDMTRIADSDPRDWAAICTGNAKELGHAIDAYRRRLSLIRNALSSPAVLEKYFADAGDARKKLLKK